MISLGTWICGALKENGIDTVFGIPGVHTVELYRGLEGAGLRHVTPRHEQGAGFMADGYARVTGRPAACFIITGPGLTNIATAMGQAYGDSIPMLVISTVNPAGAMGSGCGFLHELKDQQQLLAQVSAFSHTVLTLAEVSTVFAKAFTVLSSGRPRPVHIEIPVDLLSADAGLLGPARKLALPVRPVAAGSALSAATDDCAKATRPLIVAGGGSLDAAAEIAAFAERLDAPVLMTTNARGVLPSDHPLAISVWPGSEAGLAALREADLIIALGTELGPTDFGRQISDQSLPRLIRCDIDPAQIMLGRLPDLPVISDVKDFVTNLSRRVKVRPSGAGANRAALARGKMEKSLDIKQRAALRLLYILRDSAPGAIIAGDSTQPIYAGCAAFAAAMPRQFFSSATGFGTLGYALPAAIGARLAADDSVPVFAVVGDGGAQFTLTEMGTANDAEAPVIAILWNNRGYGEIKSSMAGAGMIPVAVDIYVPDFKLLAQGYDWGHVTASSPEKLEACVKKCISEGKSCVIEVDEQTFVSAFEKS